MNNLDVILRLVEMLMSEKDKNIELQLKNKLLEAKELQSNKDLSSDT